MNATASNAQRPCPFAVVHLPDFALQAVLRHEPEAVARPVAPVDPAQTTPASSTHAGRQGRRGGTRHTAVQAMARCRSVVIRHRSTKQEAAAVEAMLQVAFGFTPHLELTGPGMMTLDPRGLAELRDEDPDTAAPRLAAWARRLQTALGALGLTARIGTGPTPMSPATPPAGAAASNSSATPLPSSPPSPSLRWHPHPTWPTSSTNGACAPWAKCSPWDRRNSPSASDWNPSPFSPRPRPEPCAPEPGATDRTLCGVPEFDPPIETLEPLFSSCGGLPNNSGHRLECCGLVAASLRLTLRQNRAPP